MKKFYLFICVIIASTLIGCSNEDNLSQKAQPKTEDTDISATEAVEIAKSFMAERKGNTRANTANYQVAYTDKDAEGKTRSTATTDENPAYYVVTTGNKGFVLVSGTKATYTVLGYSDESSFDPNNIPYNMKGVLAAYKRDVTYSRNANMKASNTISPTMNLGASRAYGSYGIRPLLGNIKWNQSPYYNAYCPASCPVGCVATATSQIMRYWKYPERGTGTTWYNSSYGQLSFNYNYNINWDAMPEGTLRFANYEIARLCYGVAVGIRMNFSPSGSGAYQQDVPALLKQHYGYPNTVRSLERNNYTYNQWANIIINELSHKRPVQYAGSGTGGGHSFVCDGYDGSGYFHFNWGWGGMADGYFVLNALNPGSLGTGGGAGGFNYWQTIVIGFEPPAGYNDGNNDNNGNDNNNGNNDNTGNDDNDNVEPDEPVVADYPASKGKIPNYLYIYYVQMNSMSNYSGMAGYSDFTNKTFYAYPGKYCSYRIQPYFPRDRYYPYFRAWIDYNNDHKFTDDERIINQQCTSCYVYGYFTVPSTVKRGNYRVRISMKYGGYAQPDETFNWGEVEDYTLNVQ